MRQHLCNTSKLEQEKKESKLDTWLQRDVSIQNVCDKDGAFINIHLANFLMKPQINR